jgi:hypothetical protein
MTLLDIDSLTGWLSYHLLVLVSKIPPSIVSFCTLIFSRKADVWRAALSNNNFLEGSFGYENETTDRTHHSQSTVRAIS